ncbi:MAG: Thermostable hemolysin [Proteobacteria bacterium]|nr:Thermostable hemolysin [Pseudomonadota bacterium]
MSAAPNTLPPPLELRSSFNSLFSFLFPREKSSPATNRSQAGANAVSAFELIEQVGPGRAVAEQFISQRFAESFGSRVDSFMPRLFTLRDQHGVICGAFGLRSANRKLFLEQYLDLPIEKAIAARLGSRIDRQCIVEVGHFSGTFPGAVRAMICLLTERLHREGFAWVTFTGTASLRNAFSRMGLAPLDIQAAAAERLPAEERAAWGSYYQHAPHVLVGNIKEGYGALVSRAAVAEHRPEPTV